MIGFYNYSVILTYIGLVSSVFGITQVFENHMSIAFLCLLLSGICDLFDGKIARSMKNRTEHEKVFGIQIDSLNDLVCFGVLPASIGAAFGMKSIVSHALLSLYVLAALIRLGYFNVTEEKRQEESTEDRTHYLGLPVTAVCIVMPAVYLISSYTNAGAVSLFNIMFPIMALAFISPLKIKKLRLPGIIAAGALIVAEAGMIASSL